MLLGLLRTLSSFIIRFGYGVELLLGCILGLNDVDLIKVPKFIVSCPESELCMATYFVQIF